MNSIFLPHVQSESPKIVTILPTYKCTAACRECCFESNPSITHRLSLEELLATIDNVMDSFADLELIVFSGGECFAIGDDLYECIRKIRAKNPDIMVRCVTNGFWGKSGKKARKIAGSLHTSGLYEINFSTGLDHQEWVSLDAVMNAASACLENGIKTLITIEADDDDSGCLSEFVSHPNFTHLTSSEHFSYQVNTWMPFHENHRERKEACNREALLNTGCDQLFHNVVVTPHGRLSSCCGLTFEHIPEMIIGSAMSSTLLNVYQDQYDDFLKMWIKVDGAYNVLKTVYGSHPQISEDLERINHQCHACALLYKIDRKENEIGNHIDSNLIERVVSVINARSHIVGLTSSNIIAKDSAHETT